MSGLDNLTATSALNGEISLAPKTEQTRPDEALRRSECLLTGQKKALQAALDRVPLETSLGVLVQTAVEWFGPNARAAFYRANATGETLHHVVGMSEAYGRKIDGFKIGHESLACGLATYRGHAVLTRDVREEPLWQPWLWLAEEFDYRACWSFPIHTCGGRFVGTLAVYWQQPREATSEEVNVAEILTESAAIIMLRDAEAQERQLAGEALAVELERARLLQRLSTELIQAGGSEVLYEKILDIAVALMHSDFASLQMLYPERGEGGALRLLGHRGFTEEAAKLWEWIRPDSECTCAEAFRTNQRYVVRDVRQSNLPIGGKDLEAYAATGIVGVQTTPLVSRSGKLLGMVSTHWRKAHEPSEGELRAMDVLARQAADLLERKMAEEKLEQLVAERTATLQELVGELEHFSYTITHDLKSPLRAMLGFAEIAALAIGNGAQNEAKDSLQRISASAGRMECLITDALSYSRAMQQELPLTDVDTAALLRGMLDTYPELQPSKAHIRVEGNLPVVLGNAAGVTQCFSNLLGNAVKFVRAGEKPEICVGAEVLAHGDDSGWARIWVQDNGIGISKEMLPRVFDMFSRGSKQYEGTGIGLALVRKVTQRMGGRVGVDSQEGKGSRLWIELRLGQTRLKPGRVELTVVEPNGGTVLYVEDEETDAMFMKRGFERNQLESALRVVEDGRAAIDYLSGTGKYADRTEFPLPSVVLLDLNLPQVPGFGVLEWIRNHPDFARTPVIVFSSSTRDDDRLKALELGANEFVGKPGSGLKFGEVVEWLKEKWLSQLPEISGG